MRARKSRRASLERYQPLPAGFSAMRATAVSPAPSQPTSHTLHPEGPTSVTSPVARLTISSRRHAPLERRIPRSSSDAPPVTSVPDTSREYEPGSAARTSSRRPSCDQTSCSADPGKLAARTGSSPGTIV